MSLILNFLTEISIIEGHPQTLPQIKIYDDEATSCLNVTAIICPNNLRLIIICRLGTRHSVRSSVYVKCAFAGAKIFLVEIVGDRIFMNSRHKMPANVLPVSYLRNVQPLAVIPIKATSSCGSLVPVFNQRMNSVGSNWQEFLKL
jgi:hypothetical protein